MQGRDLTKFEILTTMPATDKLFLIVQQIEET